MGTLSIKLSSMSKIGSSPSSHAPTCNHGNSVSSLGRLKLHKKMLPWIFLMFPRAQILFIKISIE